MPVLHLTIRWLATEPGRTSYHGQEWPPSPARVFRALLAGACRPGGAGTRGIEALQRLERLGPPVILAPAAERLDPIRTAVPNNDGDRILHLYHQGRPDQARKKASSLRTMRLRHGWAVPGPVQYRWHFPEPDPDPGAYEALAAGLTILGQGVDLACAEVSWAEQEWPRWGFIWEPNEAVGAEGIAVPSEGEVERLEAAYRNARVRIRGTEVTSTREPPVRLAIYQDPLGPPPKRWQAFTLRNLDDSGPWSVPGQEAVRVSGMVRHAIHRAARQAGLGEDTVSQLMGHGGPGRVFVLPIPNVGHEWADGRIRRVIVAAPPAVAPEAWDAVVLRLTAAELIDEHTGEIQGLLAPVGRTAEDRLLWRFTDSATLWSSASPVILPGFDSRRGRARPLKAVRRLLKHAGIPVEAVRRVRLDDAPRLAGVFPSPGVRVPHYLASYPRAFVTVEFQCPVPGPLLLGAGEGVGLGLLTHCEHFSDESRPEQRSRVKTAAGS